MANQAKYKQWLDDEHLDLLKSWKRDGLSDEQIASNVHISRKTLTRWKARFPAIRDALHAGKEFAIAQVKNAFFELMQGHEVQETEVFFDFVDGKQIPVRGVTRKRYIPANFSAIAFYLKTQEKEMWGQVSDEYKHKMNVEAKKLELEARRIEQELNRKSEAENEKIVIVDEWSDNDAEETDDNNKRSQSDVQDGMDDEKTV